MFDVEGCWLTPGEQDEAIEALWQAGLLKCDNWHKLPLKSGGTGWNGHKKTASTIPAILPGSGVTSATARSIPVTTKNSGSGRTVRTVAGYGTAPAARSSTSPQWQST